MFQPDMAAIVLSNQDDCTRRKVKVGDRSRSRSATTSKSIYKGEVVGLEADLQGRREDELTVRAHQQAAPPAAASGSR